MTLGLGGSAVESLYRFKLSRIVISNKIKTKTERKKKKKKKKKSIAGIHRADFATQHG